MVRLAGVSEKSRCGIAAAEYNSRRIIAGLYCIRKGKVGCKSI